MFIYKYTFALSLAIVFTISGISTASAQPDLVINSFSASTTEVELGVPFTASVTMTNQGSSNVEIPPNGASVYYSIFISSDDTLDASDVCAGYGGIFYQLLTAGSTVTSGQANMQVNPEDAMPGTYNLIAMADKLCEFGNNIVESDETNNILTGDLITMLPSTAVVDLTISDLIGPNRVVLNDWLRLDTFITNLGPDTAPGRTPSSCGHLTGFYLSTDTNITTSDIVIGSICLNDLAGETTYRFWKDVHIPVNTPLGQYYWGVISDYTDVLVETDETNNTFAASKRVRVSAGVCGDGTVNQASEECDDGNAINGDGCESDCTVTPTGGFCGDGFVDAGEECDDGNAVNGDGCETDCTVTPTGGFCGDGFVDAGEECDDGNAVNGDGCETDCTVTPAGGVCGDGALNSGEECDDGNRKNGDGCDRKCKLESTGGVCGDGVVDAGEECDDGNTVNGDGCENDCTVTSSGSAEVCDDGIDNDGDGKVDCADRGDCRKDPAC